ncbi:hypothetical protein CLV59_107118 [Chitinophaga dinghuensis]|uniref:AhpC/TSA family protein n=1 Tax=Chitinophaga dinghuensis TaxID=1539050 RepID=A0A327VQ42_9BACT|nr:hypothetical protein [Chitinophaga dinghuensis]RAJ77351.1 hypothetical protein CLV59_107118 [Chitinophaga dinghuensis]
MRKFLLPLLLLVGGIGAVMFTRLKYEQTIKLQEATLRATMVDRYNANATLKDQRWKDIIAMGDNGALLKSDAMTPVQAKKGGDVMSTIIPPVLVFRFTSMNCGTCVDSTIDVFKQKLIGTSLEKHVLFLVSYDYENYLNEWVRLNEIKLPIFSIPLNDMPLLAEKENAPYLFYYGKDQTVSYLFFPDKHDKASTMKYLDLMKNKFFNN